MKKVLIVLGAGLALAACSESSTAPTTRRASAPSKVSMDDDITCRSGYVIAYDENGNPYCAPAGGDSATRKP